MSDDVREYLRRLKSVGTVSFDLRMTQGAIMSRIRKGMYEVVEIDGRVFIVCDESGAPVECGDCIARKYNRVVDVL